MQTLLHLAVLTLTIVALARWNPGVHVKSMASAVLVAVVFSLLNFFLGWLVGFGVKAILFIPAVLSLGLLFVLVPFIVNTVLLWMTDKVMDSFEIDSTRSLVVSAAVITAVNALFHISRYSQVVDHTRWV